MTNFYKKMMINILIISQIKYLFKLPIQSNIGLCNIPTIFLDLISNDTLIIRLFLCFFF